MVRITSQAFPVTVTGAVDSSVYLIDAVGLAADTKPVEKIATGSTFMEIDTGKVYFFSEASHTWLEAGGSNA